MEDAFKCPLTQEIMEDPVMAADGHSYESSALQNWFRVCSCTCSDSRRSGNTVRCSRCGKPLHPTSPITSKSSRVYWEPRLV